jgi:hypothetical protein
VELEEAPELRFKDSDRTFVPENMIRTAELFFLGHLGREDGVDRGIVEAVSLPQSLASGFVSGGDEKIRVLTEVEAVLEEKRNIRNEEGRAQFAGGCRRFKTFLANPGMDDPFQILPGGGIPEDNLPQGRATDRPVRSQNSRAKPGGYRFGHLPGLPEKRVNTGVRIENHGAGKDLRKEAASGGFPAGDSPAKAEDMHAPTYRRCLRSCNLQIGQRKAGGRFPLRPHE